MEYSKSQPKRMFLRVPDFDEFSRLVEAYEGKYKDLDSVYTMALQKLKKISLQDLGSNDVESVLRPYFLKWGQMNRVLGIRGCQVICDKLKQLSPKIEKFRFESLSVVDLDANSESVKIYDGIMDAKWKSEKGKTKRVGPTSASKALHLVAPDLFMIWDRKIRNYYDFQEGGEEYLRFLVNMKNWLKKLKPTIDLLGNKYQKPSTKIIDEYNWIKSRT